MKISISDGAKHSILSSRLKALNCKDINIYFSDYNLIVYRIVKKRWIGGDKEEKILNVDKGKAYIHSRLSPKMYKVLENYLNEFHEKDASIKICMPIDEMDDYLKEKLEKADIITR